MADLLLLLCVALAALDTCDAQSKLNAKRVHYYLYPKYGGEQRLAAGRLDILQKSAFNSQYPTR